MQLAAQIRAWAGELGFGAVGIADLELATASARLREWLAQERHGTMAWLERHEDIRSDPQRLLQGAIRSISVRIDYLPEGTPDGWEERELGRTREDGKAIVALYARGRDYHKVVRARLADLAQRIREAVRGGGYRVLCDSAPALEVELATKAGIGWRGKHTLLLAREAGSMFFLGEILTDLPLPVDAPTTEHCGSCTRCIDVCPTKAILAPYVLDARRCISYLTIEHEGPIPLELRPLLGNRIYGCDDCQLVCPWNRYARTSGLADFDVRNGLDGASLLELFAWSREDFERRLEGSPIRRIGYERWSRNLAVGLGNARPAHDIATALQGRLATESSEMVAEHLRWALERQSGLPL